MNNTINKISIGGNVYDVVDTWRPLGTGASDACAGNDSRLSDARPANGGNAATVNNHSVNSDVPNNAVFTDTTYEFNTAYNASTNKAATMADIPSISGKEDKMAIASVLSGATALTAAVGNYYVFAGTVGTMTVTLPEITGATTVGSLVLNFTTSSSPNMIITAQGGYDVSYYSDYAIEASKSYELNCLWNGTKWIVAYGRID